MTNKWEAVTESGTKYFESEDGLVYVDSERRGKFSMKSLILKNVDRDAFEDRDFWGYIHGLPESEFPELGKAIFVSNYHEWNLSTPVVSITFPGKEK